MSDLNIYLIIGFSSITIFSLLVYFAPFVVMLSLGLLLIAVMSLAIGYVIVDSYKMWREDNDKNTSRKKTPPSKDAW